MFNTYRFLTSHPLTRNAKLAAFYRFANWQVRCRLSKVVTVPWIRGTKLVLERGMSGATGNIYAGLHEFADMFFLLHLLRPEDLFCDVGANVGSYTILAAGVCGARTASIEADPGTAKTLLRNIEANSLTQLVELFTVAVGASEGEVRFTIGKDAMNRVAESGDTLTRLVRQRRLDDLLADRNPVFMKIDVEGYEEQALQGAETLLSNQSLVAIETEGYTEAVRSVLSRHGFKRRFYDPYTRRLGDTDFGHRPNNVLMVRNVDFVADRLASAARVSVLGNSI